MTTNKNNGTAVAVQENSNSAVLTAVVVRTPDNGERKAVNILSDLIEPSNYNARKLSSAAP